LLGKSITIVEIDETTGTVRETKLGELLVLFYIMNYIYMF